MAILGGLNLRGNKKYFVFVLETVFENMEKRVFQSKIFGKD